MKKFSRLSVSGSLLVIACAALATTVIPPSFDDLVGRAEIIFQGTVTDVRSEWTGEGAQRHIMSYVTVKVEEAIKGHPGESVSLRMPGDPSQRRNLSRQSIARPRRRASKPAIKAALFTKLASRPIKSLIPNVRPAPRVWLDRGFQRYP